MLDMINNDRYDYASRKTMQMEKCIWRTEFLSFMNETIQITYWEYHKKDQQQYMWSSYWNYHTFGKLILIAVELKWYFAFK